MNRLLNFLEQCGTAPEYESMSPSELAVAAREAGLSDEECLVLASNDRAGLIDLVGASPKLSCCVFPAKDPQPDQGDEQPGDAPEEPDQPSQRRLAA